MMHSQPYTAVLLPAGMLTSRLWLLLAIQSRQGAGKPPRYRVCALKRTH